MKKQNNRYRNNSNNNAYTLNYKFDSVSIAGKISGTALDLIRRYNDLAKEAQSSGDYVEMEIYRQYAEHYRKIVTDINERRQARQENNRPVEVENNSVNSEEENKEEANTQHEVVEAVSASNGYVETLPASAEVATKTFEVVEIKDESENSEVSEAPKAKRVYRRRVAAKKTAEA
ncbi:MAG: DUF4167 domain-containing protein [Alphaproteobacteria bacterium]|nr:DUF4167 domain-containing protein [Alphaproteobacteria bacterium]